MSSQAVDGITHMTPVNFHLLLWAGYLDKLQGVSLTVLFKDIPEKLLNYRHDQDKGSGASRLKIMQVPLPAE